MQSHEQLLQGNLEVFYNLEQCFTKISHTNDLKYIEKITKISQKINALFLLHK